MNYGVNGCKLIGNRWAVRLAMLLGVRAIHTYGAIEPAANYTTNGGSFATSVSA